MHVWAEGNSTLSFFPLLRSLFIHLSGGQFMEFYSPVKPLKSEKCILSEGYAHSQASVQCKEKVASDKRLVTCISCCFSVVKCISGALFWVTHRARLLLLSTKARQCWIQALIPRTFAPNYPLPKLILDTLNAGRKRERKRASERGMSP